MQLISVGTIAGESHLIFRLDKNGRIKYPLVNLEYQPLDSPKIALVLSGGGARGFAHVGVLKALEERKVPIHLIVGSSIGSIVGGLYAAGYSSEQIASITRQVDWNNIFSDETYRPHLFLSQKSLTRRHLVQLRFDGLIPYIPSSLTQGQKVFNFIYSRLLKANFQAANKFDDLKIPFRSVATDLLTGKRVVLDHGDLAEAITASISIPLLFAPVEIDGMLLVDGGITDNLPVDVARELGADFVIAVDATSQLRNREEMRAPWEIADQVTTIMMQAPTRQKRREADFLIQPDLEGYKTGNFSQIDSIIQTGYISTLQIIDSLKSMINRKLTEKPDQNEYLGKATLVHFMGASKSFWDSLNCNLYTRSGNHIYKQDIVRDLKAIYQTGYVQNVYASVEGDTGARTVTFYVKAQPVVREVKVVHHQILSNSLIYTTVHLQSQGILNIHQLLSQMDSLRNLLIQKGYSLATIRSIQYQPEKNLLTIRIDEGLITDVKIVGNQRTKNSIILREFPLKRGHYFSANLAIQGIRNIYSTGLFDRVSVNVQKKEGENVLIIKVKERKYLLMRLGAHGSTERKSEGFIEILEDNLLGTATKMSLFGSVGDLIRRAELSIYTFRLFNTYLTYRLTLYYRELWYRYYRDYHRRGDYMIARRGAHFVVGQQIERLGQISAELRFESVDVHSGIRGFPFDDHYRIRSLALRSVVDKRDRLPFPNKGIYNRWFWETGNQQILNSSFSFTRVFLGLEGYYPFFKQFNYHPYLFAGTSDLTLPFSEYFSFGGQNSFPGLHDREKFGRQFLLTGIDLRYRIAWQLPIEIFLKMGYTVGAAWERPDDRIKRKDFLYSIHFTLALNSILGPIQLTYGKILNRRDVLYFSMGFDF